jgi:alkylation response protein AidB-like acyl-CoA dehydrogenase
MAEWDETGTYPKELHQKAYDAGLYGAMWPAAYGGTPPAGCDAFHDLILIDELSRCARFCPLFVHNLAVRALSAFVAVLW